MFPLLYVAVLALGSAASSTPSGTGDHPPGDENTVVVNGFEQRMGRHMNMPFEDLENPRCAGPEGEKPCSPIQNRQGVWWMAGAAQNVLSTWSPCSSLVALIATLNLWIVRADRRLACWSTP